MKWTAVLNPGQNPIDVSDQHVYALTKELQFRNPDIFSQYFPIFRQLHILVEGSVLVQILTENKFSMIGLSAVVDVNNIKRVRYTSQITLCATDLSPYDWLRQILKDNTSFLYGKCVIDLQITVLLYVRSIREGNFKLHVEVLYKLLSWYFINDHYNCARRFTIHWFDLYTIETKFPDVCNFLSKANFSLQRSLREFSRMGLDQICELSNKLIKGSEAERDLLSKIDNSTLICWET